MAKSLKYVFLLLLITNYLSAHLVTSIITVVETSPGTTPCTQLSPITNRMQWAQQCAMALSNIVPPGITPTGTTCFESKCSTSSTTSVKGLSISSFTSGSEAGPTSCRRRCHASTETSTTSSPDPARTSDSDLTATDGSSSHTNVGMIAGAVSCVLAVLALLSWILWRTRKRWLGHLKNLNVGYTDAHEKYWGDNRNGQVPDGHSVPTFWSRSPQELDQSPTAPYDVRHLGSGMDGVTDCGYGRSYAVTNPDPPSASISADRSQAGSLPSWLHSEPADGADSVLRPDSNIFSPSEPNENAGIGEYPTPMAAESIVYTPYRPPESRNRPRLSC